MDYSKIFLAFGKNRLGNDCSHKTRSKYVALQSTARRARLQLTGTSVIRRHDGRCYGLGR